jgi:hypothetical protein
MSISIRQPLNNVTVKSATNLALPAWASNIIKNELNVKNVNFVVEQDNFEFKLNFKELSKRFKKEIKIIESFVNENRIKIKNDLISNQSIKINNEIELVKSDFILLPILEEGEVHSVSNDGIGYKLSLDTNVTDQLHVEFVLNEICASIQKLRKDNGFEIHENIFGSIELNDIILFNIIADNNLLSTIKDRLGNAEISLIFIKNFPVHFKCWDEDTFWQKINVAEFECQILISRFNDWEVRSFIGWIQNEKGIDFLEAYKIAKEWGAA